MEIYFEKLMGGIINKSLSEVISRKEFQYYENLLSIARLMLFCVAFTDLLIPFYVENIISYKDGTTETYDYLDEIVKARTNEE
jgi:hypothetical protein